MQTKHLFVVIGVLVLASIVWFFLNSPKAVAPTPVEIRDEQKTTNEVPATDHGMTAEEHAAMMAEPAPTPTANNTTPPPAQSGAKVFMVHGENFSFDPKEIRVKEGDTVTINFMSMDGFHDWVIDEFNARTEKIKTNGMSSVTFVASRKGTFEYYCSIGSHRASGMVGKLIVE